MAMTEIGDWIGFGSRPETGPLSAFVGHSQVRRCVARYDTGQNVLVWSAQNQSRGLVRSSGLERPKAHQPLGVVGLLMIAQMV
jgi:hypothetical protein